MKLFSFCLSLLPHSSSTHNFSDLHRHQQHNITCQSPLPFTKRIPPMNFFGNDPTPAAGPSPMTAAKMDLDMYTDLFNR